MLTTPAELSATTTALLPSPTTIPILRSSQDRAGAGSVALGIGDRKRLAGDQSGDIGQRVAARRTSGRRGADEGQVVAQHPADRVGVDDLVARGFVGRGAGERKDHVATRAALDLRIGTGPVGATKTLTRVPLRACHSLPTDFSDRLERGLAVDHEVARIAPLGWGNVQRTMRHESALTSKSRAANTLMRATVLTGS